jgi:hypothetical protein
MKTPAKKTKGRFEPMLLLAASSLPEPLVLVIAPNVADSSASEAAISLGRDTGPANPEPPL